MANVKMMIVLILNQQITLNVQNINIVVQLHQQEYVWNNHRNVNCIQLKINVFKLCQMNHVFGCQKFKMVKNLKNVLNSLNVKMQILLIIYPVNLFHHIVQQMESIVFQFQNVRHMKSLDAIKVLIKWAMSVVCIFMHTQHQLLNNVKNLLNVQMYY